VACPDNGAGRHLPYCGARGRGDLPRRWRLGALRDRPSVPRP
jgi:hypothetical protein